MSLDNRNHFLSLQNRWVLADPTAASSMANALDTIAVSVFADPEMIGYELLQNADDAAASEIEYVFHQEYLIVRHNGAAFTKQNVEALCRFGATDTQQQNAEGLEIIQEDGELEKQEDIKKIGYKGIGFKSVFRISEQVWVFSGNGYSFRYDKSNWNGRRLPWQIMPVTTDEVPGELRQWVKPDWVNFVFKINPDVRRGAFERVLDSLDFKIAKLFAHEHIVLFLRKIQSMTLIKSEGLDVREHRRITRHTSDNIHEIKRFDNQVEIISSRWLVKSFHVEVHKDLRDELARLTNIQFPDKLKRAKQIEISFAARFGARDELVAQTETLIFSYLPTAKRYRNLPFFVNSNFLLNHERTELLTKNPWNRFLFEQIGYLQFKWFEELAKEERFRHSFPDLIAKYADSATDYNAAINTGVEKAKNEIAFVPIIENAELKKAPETIVDKTGIGEQANEYQFVKDSFENKDLSIVDPKLRSINKIIQVGANKFDREELQAALRKKNRFSNPADNIRLIDFFFKKIGSLANNNDKQAWHQVLRETPFLLTNSATLREPPTLYFPESKPDDLPIEFDMEFLHEEVFRDRVSKDEPLKGWLASELLVAVPKPIEIIRRGLIPMIQEGRIQREFAIRITRFIFKYRSQLLGTDFQQLKLLPVFYKRLEEGNDFKKVAGGYLADHYLPSLPLESLVDEDIFISAEYPETEHDVAEWKWFWKKLGVRENMDFDFHEGDFDLRNNQVRTHANEYLSWLRREGNLPDYNANQVHRLKTNLDHKYLKYAEKYEFSIRFWTVFFEEKWVEFKRLSLRAKFQHSVGTSDIPSFFHFRTHTNPYFPATNGNCYPVPEVYSSTLEKIIGTWKPLSFFNLDAEKEAYLGIRTELTKEECLDLLGHISELEGTVDRERIGAIYRYMVNRRFALSEDEEQPELNLLAQDNSFQPIAKLSYFDLPRFAQKVDTEHFIFLDLEVDSAAAFCRNWRINIISIDEIQFQVHGIDISDFSNRFNTRLSAFAAVVGNKTGKSQDEAENSLREINAKIEWKSATQLSLHIYNEYGLRIFEKEVKAWKNGNTIYHLSPWNDAITLFELSEVVAKAFEVSGFERELGLLLSLEKEQQVIEWLKSNGYETAGVLIADENTTIDELIPPLFDDGQEEELTKEYFGRINEKTAGTSVIKGGEGGLKKDDIVVISNDTKAMAIAYLEKDGWLVVNNKYNEDGILEDVQKDGKTYSFIVLSAKAGLLYLGQTNWKKLGFGNYKMLVLTGDKLSDFRMFSSQEELLELPNNDYNLIVKQNTKDPEVLTQMVKDLKEEDSARFYFQIKKGKSLFEDIKGFESDNKAEQQTASVTEEDI